MLWGLDTPECWLGTVLLKDQKIERCSCGDKRRRRLVQLRDGKPFGQGTSSMRKDVMLGDFPKVP